MIPLHRAVWATCLVAPMFGSGSLAAERDPYGGVVAVGDGSDIVLLERASGKELRCLKGHQDDILEIAFAPDGRLLVSDSYDLTALVWEVR